jgi:aryl-alcohol dehydrogenase-like predicted oxidoreductase
MSAYGQVTVKGSNLSIGRVGFGAARILGDGEFRASAKLIEQALELGIRHFDTAPTYGNGQSEMVLGAVLQGVPSITITTKFGFGRPSAPLALSARQTVYRRIVRPVLTYFPSLKTSFMKPQPGGYQDGDLQLVRDDLHRSLDESCKLLRRDPDILLIHEARRFQLNEESHLIFDALIQEGRIRAYGTGTGDFLGARSLGTVCQARYSGDPTSSSHAGQTAILHGVLRGSANAGVARKALSQAMDSNPDAAFLISASLPHQLRSLLQPLRHRSED